MWELDCEESWVPKNWCFWTVVLEKTLFFFLNFKIFNSYMCSQTWTPSPLDCKEIQPVNPKGNQSWIFISRMDAEAKTPILWPPDAKNRLIGKDPDAGKDWRQAEKVATEDEMVGWHHRLDRHEFEQAPWVGMDKEAWLAAVHGVRVRHDWAIELTITLAEMFFCLHNIDSHRFQG